MNKYTNPAFVQVTNDMAERYTEAKLAISWAEGEASKHPVVKMGQLRETMRQLHQAWPPHTNYADANFPALLDQFDEQWNAVKSSLIAY